MEEFLERTRCLHWKVQIDNQLLFVFVYISCSAVAWLFLIENRNFITLSLIVMSAVCVAIIGKDVSDKDVLTY